MASSRIRAMPALSTAVLVGGVATTLPSPPQSRMRGERGVRPVDALLRDWQLDVLVFAQTSLRSDLFSAERNELS